MPRPRNIRISGPFATAEIGEHSYDGGGNLVLLRPAAGVATFAELTGPPPSFAPGGAAILESFFLYDAYGRLRTWNDKTGKSQDYDFDAFGNLTRITDFDGLHPATYRNFAVSQANNQLTSLVSYDNRGNLKARSLGTSTETYDWDLFDQLAAQTFPAATHLYTADGEKIWTLRYNAGTKQLDETFTLRGLGNQVLTVYQHQSNNLTGQNVWSWQEDYIYRGSQLLAKATNQPAPLDKIHFTLDHLGTARVATNANGQPFEGYHYLPYGEQYGGTLNSSERMRYTGHERDQNQSGTVDDLDYMHARYCSPNLGRFLSPDPQLGRIAAPQSWNRYSYAANNPMNYTDPTGEYVTTCAQDDAACNKKAAAFEKARQELLNSDDAEFRSVATVWGNAGEKNGIVVSFKKVKTRDAGAESTFTANVDSETGKATLGAQVIIGPYKSDVALKATVAHEGSHIRDAKAFVATYQWGPPPFDISKNLTSEQTETKAYMFSHLVYKEAGAKFNRPCSGCTIGAGLFQIEKINQAIHNIIHEKGGPYVDKLDRRMLDSGSQP